MTAPAVFNTWVPFSPADQKGPNHDFQGLVERIAATTSDVPISEATSQAASSSEL